MSDYGLQDALELAEEWAEEFYPDSADEQEAFIDGCMDALAAVFAAWLERGEYD